MPSLNAVDSPLLHTKSISFSRFRTAGMNRSVRQGSHERFVTSQRLLTLLRGTRLGKGPLEFPGAGDDEEDSIMGDTTEDEDDVIPGARPRQRGKLEAVGFTEFMDSAINKAVLDELLFRGGHLAEYEEPDEPHHDFSSDTESAPSPFPSPFQPTLNLPPLEQFNARHLQSSTSRSPIGQRRSSLSSSVAEDSGEEDISGEDDEDEEMHGDDEESGDERGRGSSSRLFRPRYQLQRRSSGSAFAPATAGRDEDDSEDRGRDRSGRDPHPVGAGPRGRVRYNKSLVPPSAFLSRSSSVPAPYHGPHHSHGHGSHHNQGGSYHRGVSLDTERSSSVPASVSGRRGRGATRIVQVLEGSVEVKAIRALDLCGCVSKVFM